MGGPARTKERTPWEFFLASLSVSRELVGYFTAFPFHGSIRNANIGTKTMTGMFMSAIHLSLVHLVTVSLAGTLTVPND